MSWPMSWDNPCCCKLRVDWQNVEKEIDSRLILLQLCQVVDCDGAG